MQAGVTIIENIIIILNALFLVINNILVEIQRYFSVYRFNPFPFISIASKYI